MFFRYMVPALAGLSSLVAAMPTSGQQRDAAGHNKKRDVIIQQTVIEPQVVVINQNLGALSALALQAEQEFAALVQSQLTLINTVETIKNNIRINTFKSRWAQVNTVIVTVTQVVDARDPANVNTRYMVNQLKADNGNPESEILVFMTAADALQIGPQPTPPSLNIPGVDGVGTALPQPTGQASSGSTAAQVQQLDPAQAFGQAANGSVLLPYNSTAPAPPSGAQLFADPAAIILPNQGNLFVGDVNAIQQDAALLAAAGTLFNLQQQLLAQQAIAQAELAGVLLGSASPPTIIINENGNGQQGQAQAQAQAQQQAQQQAQAQAQAQAQQQAEQQAQQQQAQAQQSQEQANQTEPMPMGSSS